MAASASWTGMPSSANSLAVWLLPMPIEPVRPMTYGLAMGQHPFQQCSQSLRHLRFDAEKGFERRRRLVHQHPQPVQTDMPALPCFGQQIGLQGIVDDVANRRLLW